MLDTPNAITGPVVAVRAIVIHRQIVLRDPVERPQQPATPISSIARAEADGVVVVRVGRRPTLDPFDIGRRVEILPFTWSTKP
jgi:hypothetical protein